MSVLCNPDILNVFYECVLTSCYLIYYHSDLRIGR